MKYASLLFLTNIGFAIAHNSKKNSDSLERGLIDNIYDELVHVVNECHLPEIVKELEHNIPIAEEYLEGRSRQFFDSMAGWMGFGSHTLTPKKSTKKQKTNCYKHHLYSNGKKIPIPGKKIKNTNHCHCRCGCESMDHNSLIRHENEIIDMDGKKFNIFEIGDNLYSSDWNKYEIDVPNVDELNLEIEMMLRDILLPVESASVSHLQEEKSKNKNSGMIWPPYATNTSPSNAARVKKARNSEIKKRRHHNQPDQLIWPPYVTNIKTKNNANTMTYEADNHTKHADTGLIILRIIFVAALATVTTMITYQVFRFIAIHVFGLVEPLQDDDDDEEMQRKLLYPGYTSEDLLIKKSASLTTM